MFLREYIKCGFIDAVGQMPDYKIILNSAGWLDKGVLTEEDLQEINAVIQAQYEEVQEENEELPIDQDGEEITEVEEQIEEEVE